MGVFGFPDKAELEEFKREIQARIDGLSQQVIRTASESAAVANESATKIGLLEGEVQGNAEKIKEILVAAEHFKTEASRQAQLLKEEHNNFLVENAAIAEKTKVAREHLESICESKNTVDKAVSDINQKVAEVNEYLKQSESFPEAVEQLSSQLEDSAKNGEKINSLLAHSIKKKGDIDELYKKIYGEDIKSDDGGEVEHTDGVVDELEKVYNALSDRIEKLSRDIDNKVLQITSKHELQFGEQSKAFDGLLVDSGAKIDSVNAQLKALLPGAMAAGLSAAYEKKTEDEIKSLERFDETFRWAIFALVCVSLIPFSVDIYLLGWQSKDLVQVIKDTPSLIVSILPLYFPVLWLAYSSNKKVNLSKRLIEEYTHKSVLGKTFSGLSNQIDNIPHEGAVKDELRTRLLFNVLQVSAENPGKLISNYQKSNHPLMEALENSAKLSDVVDTLTKIPGFGALAKKLTEKSDNLMDAQIKKVEQGLKIQDALDIPLKE